MVEKVLIVPLWNWNDIIAGHNSENFDVLIVPLWNWNNEADYLLKFKVGFNRTFMELKFIYMFISLLSTEF